MNPRVFGFGERLRDSACDSSRRTTLGAGFVLARAPPRRRPIALCSYWVRMSDATQRRRSQPP